MLNNEMAVELKKDHLALALIGHEKTRHIIIKFVIYNRL